MGCMVAGALVLGVTGPLGRSFLGGRAGAACWRCCMAAGPTVLPVLVAAAAASALDAAAAGVAGAAGSAGAGAAAAATPSKTSDSPCSSNNSLNESELLKPPGWARAAACCWSMSPTTAPGAAAAAAGKGAGQGPVAQRPVGPCSAGDGCSQYSPGMAGVNAGARDGTAAAMFARSCRLPNWPTPPDWMRLNNCAANGCMLRPPTSPMLWSTGQASPAPATTAPGKLPGWPAGAAGAAAGWGAWPPRAGAAAAAWASAAAAA